MGSFTRMVKTRKTTWAKLIRMGLVLEARPGRKSVAAIAFEKLSKIKDV